MISQSDLNDLLALLPDNANGAITAENMRSVVTSLHGDSSAVADVAFNNSNDIAGLAARMQGVEQGLSNVTQDLGGVANTVNTILLPHDAEQRNQIANLEADLSVLQTTVDVLGPAVESLNTQLNDLTARVVALEGG
jgi:hypothetical protein